MVDESDDELERIRERKRRELIEKAGTGNGGEATPAPDEPIEITDREHFESVLNSYEVVLVDCYADWCGPCQMMEPVIEELASTTQAAVGKLDVDANQQLAAELGARSIPTLLIYAGGEPVDRMVGAQDRASLEAALQRAAH